MIYFCFLGGMGSRAFMHMQKSIARNVNRPNILAFQETFFLFCLWKMYCVVNLQFPNLMFLSFSATIKPKIVFYNTSFGMYFPEKAKFQFFRKVVCMLSTKERLRSFWKEQKLRMWNYFVFCCKRNHLKSGG